MHLVKQEVRTLCVYLYAFGFNNIIYVRRRNITLAMRSYALFSKAAIQAIDIPNCPSLLYKI